MLHHRMGSYYEASQASTSPAPSIVSVPGCPNNGRRPKKGILMIPLVAPPSAPPPPPPTSSIPVRAVGSSQQQQPSLHFEMEQDMRQIAALNRRLASLTIADMSPRLALRRILALYRYHI